MSKQKSALQLAVGRNGAVAAVKEGLPFYFVATLADKLDMNAYQCGERLLGMSRATLTRRRQRDKLLPDESDKVLRFTHLLQRATTLMENDEAAALAWLTSPLPILDGEAPIEYARSETGAREVDQLIGRIEHGIPC